MFLKPALTNRVSWWFLLVIRVIDNECKLSFWYIAVSTYYVYNPVYLCPSLLEQQIELVLMILKIFLLQKFKESSFQVLGSSRLAYVMCDKISYSIDKNG